MSGILESVTAAEILAALVGQIPEAADDAAAAAIGVPVGGLYNANGAVSVRES